MEIAIFLFRKLLDFFCHFPNVGKLSTVSDRSFLDEQRTSQMKIEDKKHKEAMGLNTINQLLLHGELCLHHREEFLQFFEVWFVLLRNFREHIGEFFGGSLEFRPDVNQNLNLR